MWQSFPAFPDPVADCAIEDYGAIGDCRTVALVSRYGSIDWMCAPDFSSPSCFASLLDRQRGGRFAMTPLQLHKARQCYLPASNMLSTRFECEGGELELVDFMAVPEADAPQQVVRIATCTNGRVDLAVLLEPRPDYARQRPRMEPEAAGRWRCVAPDFVARVESTLPLVPGADGALQARALLHAGESHVALLLTTPGASPAPSSLIAHARERLNATGC